MLKAELEAQNKDLKNKLEDIESSLEAAKSNKQIIAEMEETIADLLKRSTNGFVKRNDEEEAVWHAGFAEATLKNLPVPAAIKYAYEKHKKYMDSKN